MVTGPDDHAPAEAGNQSDRDPRQKAHERSLASTGSRTLVSVAWDPDQYLRYAGHRIRPAVELLQRVDARDVARVVDLGCGTGNTTELLAERWPGADIAGVDNSAEMLAEARAEHPDSTWIDADIASWEPDAPLDVVYSNAALHWVDDHERLFPRLVGMLAAGGVLAVQMPRNFDRPTHTMVAETVADGPWAATLTPLLRQWPVLTGQEYHRLLAPVCAEVDVWTTTYYQILTGPNPVADWTKGSVLRPLLGALDAEQGERFFESYAERVLVSYPPEADGTTVLPFTRLFVVARR